MGRIAAVLRADNGGGLKMNCKNCKYFDNTKPVDTAHNPNDRHKTAEPYIGKCKKIGRIKMMNDSCSLFERKKG
jgi:hypothetical protein